MIPALILLLLAVLMFGLGLFIVFHVMRDPATSRVLDRLAEGQPQSGAKAVGVAWLDRAFLQAGLGRPSERLGLWIGLWAGVIAVAG